MEEPLEAEVREWGLAARRARGGVEVEAAPESIWEANLRTRIASRVLLRLGEFNGQAGLERALENIDVARFSPTGAQVSARGSALSERALVVAAKNAWGLEQIANQEQAAGALFLRASGDRVVLSVDTSGELLHRRGYRQETSMAPLRETLAAGVLRLAGYRGDAPLWDPMCGSGTFLVEAAWMAMHRAPGLSRSFAFERWWGHDAAAYQALKARVANESLGAPAWPIVGSDLHAGALGTARRNARRGQVLEHLVLERRDVTRLEPHPYGSHGWVVANLPYGKRVGEPQDLKALYPAIGQSLRKHFKGWRFALLTEDTGADRLLRLETAQRIFLDNGGLRCLLSVGRVPL